MAAGTGDYIWSVRELRKQPRIVRMMEDELREAISTFAKLTHHERAIVLARFAFELTIAARDTYVPGSEQIRYPARLRALNEIQHRVTSRIVDILLQRGWERADEY